jgi:two-component system, NtrC family, sensor kinase
LKVISRSALDLQRVLDALVESAARLCNAYDAAIFQVFGDSLRLVAQYGQMPTSRPVGQVTFPLVRGRIIGRAVIDRRTIQVADALAEADEYPESHKNALQLGYRTTLAVPLVHAGKAIGAIVMRRTEVRPFAERQIELVNTFADQAVIAIENTRLFEEVQARTRELTESLEQQTATTEVLGVISSSPGELEPVFEAMLANATRLCKAKFGALSLYDGGAFCNVAFHNVPSAYHFRLREPFRPHPKSGLAQVAKTKQVVHADDLRTTSPYVEGDPAVVAIADLAGARTMMNVPMLNEDRLIGTISIFRQEVQLFSEKQIELVANFARQAVIAIENTRLLNELRESLQQQTATADVLSVISRSPTDALPVFDTIAERAEKLCDADISVVSMVDGELIRLVAIHGTTKEGIASVQAAFPMHRNNETVTARVIRTCAIVHVADVLADPEYEIKDAARTSDYRSVLCVPMIRERKVIGSISVGRRKPGLFADAQVELLKPSPIKPSSNPACCHAGLCGTHAGRHVRRAAG